MRRSTREARRRRARRRRRLRGTLLVVAVGLLALLAFMASGITDSGTGSTPPVSAGAAGAGAAGVGAAGVGAAGVGAAGVGAAGVGSAGAGTATAAVPVVKPAPPHRAYVLRPAPRFLAVRLKPAPAAGLVFNVRTGEILWERGTTRNLPIASLTKMMTALVVVAHSRPDDQVLITRAATHFTGSGVGMLPLGKRVRLEDLLYGLMLPSGNDAAIALAQHVAGNQARFIAMMNAQAHAMDLGCTHFTTVSGIVDRGNYSCADDLAVIAHAVLKQPRLGRIVSSRSASFPFPIKARKLYLYNNNPLMYLRYPGVDGVKTGYTVLAGQCLVAAARRGHRWFGVVLLHSVNTGGQAQRLLNAAFAS